MILNTPEQTAELLEMVSIRECGLEPESSEHRLYQHMRKHLEDWGWRRYQSDVDLFTQSLRDLNLTTADIPLEVFPQSIQDEIADKCRNGWAFFNGQLVSPEMLAKIAPIKSSEKSNYHSINTPAGTR